MAILVKMSGQPNSSELPLARYGNVFLSRLFYRYWDYEMYLVYETYLDLKSWVEKN